MLRLDQECCCVEKGRTLPVDIVIQQMKGLIPNVCHCPATKEMFANPVVHIYSIMMRGKTTVCPGSSDAPEKNI